MKKKYGKAVQEILDRDDFIPNRPVSDLTPGMAIRIYREKVGISQAELAKAAGMTQATISSLEHDRATLGLDRAKAIARALKIHPSVIAFPGWDVEKEAVA